MILSENKCAKYYFAILKSDSRRKKFIRYFEESSKVDDTLSQWPHLMMPDNDDNKAFIFLRWCLQN